MSKSFRTGKSGKSGKVGKPGKATARKKNSAGPIAFFVSLFIVALGTIQLVSTFHTYALNLAELNGLKREEASLVAKKQELKTISNVGMTKPTSPPKLVSVSALCFPGRPQFMCFIRKP